MADIKTYEFDVAMSCTGCSGAVERVLGKWKRDNPDLEGFEYITDLKTQKVTVRAPPTLTYDDIFEKINKAKIVSDGREIDNEAWPGTATTEA
ncbi:hypothetical protein ABW21_db0206161 [Orbilia brochopaga]|nr:hypothetical protein ABW21_db0206161 [Drechslerella brochopaga]